MTKRSRIDVDKWTYLIFTIPALLLFLYFLVYPVILGFYYSLTNWSGVGQSFEMVGFKNYLSLVKDKFFLSSISFTLRYTVIVVIFITIISLILALMLNSSNKFRTFIRAVYFFPAVLSLVTVGLIFNEIFYRVFPLIGQSLGIDFLSQNILSSKSTAIYGIALIHIWQGVALPTVIFLAGLQSIPPELLEVAVLDGANFFQRFKSIMLPYLIPALNIVTITALKGGILVFDYIMVTTGGGPGRATNSIAKTILENAFGGKMQFSYAITQSFILFVFMVGISLIQFKVFNKKEVN